MGDVNVFRVVAESRLDNMTVICIPAQFEKRKQKPVCNAKALALSSALHRVGM